MSVVRVYPYSKYSKHWPYTVAHTIGCVCSKMLNHGLNHGLFLSLFKLTPCIIHWFVYVLAYRKVASSRPVYYSIFYLFWGATNQDVLLTEMCYYCYIQKSIKWWVHKGPCVFSSIFVNSQWLALFLQISFKNVLKTLGGTFLLLWKCIFISKNWKNLIRIFEDPTFWIYFSNQNVGSSRILIRFFQFLLG